MGLAQLFFFHRQAAKPARPEERNKTVENSGIVSPFGSPSVT
jgi:hypothetical protein